MIKAGMESVLLEPETEELMKLNAVIMNFNCVCYSSFKVLCALNRAEYASSLRVKNELATGKLCHCLHFARFVFFAVCNRPTPAAMHLARFFSTFFTRPHEFDVAQIMHALQQRLKSASSEQRRQSRTSTRSTHES
jgi:hypothetical protein